MNFWSANPLLRFALIAGLGIYTSIFWQVHYSIALFSGLSLILLSVVFSFFSPQKNNAVSGLMLLLAIGLLFNWRANSYRQQTNDRLNLLSNKSYVAFFGQVLNQRSYLASKPEFDVSVFGLQKANGEITNCTFKIKATLTDTTLKPTYGDIFYCTTLPTFAPPPDNPFMFDYSKYYVLNRIFGLVNLSATNTFKITNQANIFMRTIEQFRAAYINRLRSVTSDLDYLAVSLTVGDKSGLDGDNRRTFARAGLLHVLAISGMHVGIVYVLLASLGGFLSELRHKHYYTFLVVLPLIWAYAFFAGGSASVLRASLIFSLYAISKAVSRQSSSFNSLSLAALITLFINPNWLYDAGWQLSFGAMVGIYLFAPKFLGLMVEPENERVSFFRSSIAISLGATLVTLPITSVVFHGFPLSFLLSNLLVAYPVGWAFVFSLLAGLPFLPEFISELLGGLAYGGLMLMKSIAELFAHYSQLYIENWYWAHHQIAFYVVILFLIYLLIATKSRFVLYSVLIAVVLFGFIEFNYRKQLNCRSKVELREVKGYLVGHQIKGRSGQMYMYPYPPDSVFVQQYIKPFVGYNHLQYFSVAPLWPDSSLAGGFCYADSIYLFFNRHIPKDYWAQIPKVSHLILGPLTPTDLGRLAIDTGTTVIIPSKLCRNKLRIYTKQLRVRNIKYWVL